jgi:hypothetical protein
LEVIAFAWGGCKAQTVTTMQVEMKILIVTARFARATNCRSCVCTDDSL